DAKERNGSGLALGWLIKHNTQRHRGGVANRHVCAGASRLGDQVATGKGRVSDAGDAPAAVPAAGQGVVGDQPVSGSFKATAKALRHTHGEAGERRDEKKKKELHNKGKLN